MADDLNLRMAALEAKVQKLIDIEDIRNLRFRYHVAMNERSFDDIPDLFTDDAELDFDYLGQAQGREKLVRFFAETPKILTFLKQFIHNHVVEVDGNRGTGFCYLEARTVSKVDRNASNRCTTTAFACCSSCIMHRM